MFLGIRRSDLGLGNSQHALIEEVATAAGSKTIVVAVTPGALLTPWQDAVAAILTLLVLVLALLLVVGTGRGWGW